MELEVINGFQSVVFIAVATFVLMFYLERKMLPGDVRPTAWIIAREQMLRRW